MLAENMGEGAIDPRLEERVSDVSQDEEVDQLVKQLPQHLVEQEPLLGPLLATHRPETEVSHEDLQLVKSLHSSGGVHGYPALPSDSDRHGGRGVAGGGEEVGRGEE